MFPDNDEIAHGSNPVYERLLQRAQEFSWIWDADEQRQNLSVNTNELPDWDSLSAGTRRILNLALAGQDESTYAVLPSPFLPGLFLMLGDDEGTGCDWWRTVNHAFEARGFAGAGSYIPDLDITEAARAGLLRPIGGRRGRLLAVSDRGEKIWAVNIGPEREAV